jgi:hypothetical protein
MRVGREGSRVVQNFADPDVENRADAYHDTNRDRLVRIKACYDPANVFRFHQSLPAAFAARLGDGRAERRRHDLEIFRTAYSFPLDRSSSS